MDLESLRKFRWTKAHDYLQKMRKYEREKRAEPVENGPIHGSVHVQKMMENGSKKEKGKDAPAKPIEEVLRTSDCTGAKGNDDLAVEGGE